MGGVSQKNICSCVMSHFDWPMITKTKKKQTNKTKTLEAFKIEVSIGG
jgi:hypothetical protein